MKPRYLLCIPALAVAASVALAGQVQPAPVLLDLVNRVAQGDMVTARFSDNPFEFIGCGVRTLMLADGTLFRTGFCQAGISETEFFTCFSDQTALVEKMAEGNDFSFITFAWNANGECTRVGFSTQSFYIPEHLDKKKK
jgi:hypothetical protein